MNQTVRIKQCYHACPLMKVDADGMYCAHPVFNGRPWENMIITHYNSRGRVPDKCPLHTKPFTVTYTLENYE